MHKGPLRTLLLVTMLAALAVGGTLGYRTYREHTTVPPFPAVDTAALSPARAAVIGVLEQQYAEQPGMSRYSDGNDEPWCADFTSWVMRAAGHPFANPNSGNWRIPGVLTLTDYLRSEQRWEAPGYQPQPGDMVIYDDPSPKGQHVNLVLVNDNGTLTTIGGGEGAGIGLSSFRIADDPGIRGFGRLE